MVRGVTDRCAVRAAQNLLPETTGNRGQNSFSQPEQHSGYQPSTHSGERKTMSLGEEAGKQRDWSMP